MTIDQIITLIINIGICLLFVVPVRFALAKHLGVDAKHELATKDNFAFGVSIAGGVLGLIFMLTGVQSGEALDSHFQEAMSLLLFGALGSLLLVCGVFVQDKIVMREVNLAEEIRAGNMSAAIVVATNMAVIGLVAKRTLTWVESDTWSGLLPVVAVFVLSQIVLASVALLRMAIYRSRNNNQAAQELGISQTWQGAIKAGNVAIAVRYAGQLIATGVAIAATSFLVSGEVMYLLASMAYWALYAFGLAFVIWLAYRLFLPLVLFNVNVVEEVDHQQNIGVASIEAALFISLAFMILAYLV